jgi:hypothetical protein
MTKTKASAAESMARRAAKDRRLLSGVLKGLLLRNLKSNTSVARY